MITGVATLTTGGYLAAMAGGLVPPSWAQSEVFWLGFLVCAAASVLRVAAME